MTGRPDWFDDARCRQLGLPVNLFFDPLPNQTNASGGAVYDARARRACAECPVRSECLDDALDGPSRHDSGYRAGLDEEARKRVRKARRGAA